MLGPSFGTLAAGLILLPIVIAIFVMLRTRRDYKAHTADHPEKRP